MPFMSMEQIREHTKNQVAAWRRVQRKVESFEADAIYRNATDSRKSTLINYVQNGWPTLIEEWYKEEGIITSFDALTVKELRTLARRKEVKFYSTMTKSQLIFALEKEKAHEEAITKTV